MINLRKYISRSPRTVSEKYLDDLSSNNNIRTILDYGLKGFRYITDTQVADSDTQGYYAIKAIDGSTISATSNEGDNLTNLTVLPGEIIFGNFSSVTCVSGKILVYIK